MAQDRAQTAGKRQPGLLGDLNLVYAAQLVLDWIFDGDDLADGVVDFVQRSVERRGLAAAGRAGDENDAVRQTEHAPERFQFALVETEFLHAKQRGVLPE